LTIKSAQHTENSRQRSAFSRQQAIVCFC